MARTDNLNNFLTDVATAIKTKKGDTTPIPASNFDTEITNLPSGGGGGSSKYAPRYVSFQGYTGTDLDEEIANLDTSNITNIKNMFRDCTNLKSLDVSNFNIYNVYKGGIEYLFGGCSNITSINMSNWDFSKFDTFYYLFGNCRKLSEVIFTDFNTSNAEYMHYMFAYCEKLDIIPIVSNFNTSKVTNMNTMFNQCKMLTEFTPSNFNTSKVTNMSSMFAGCSNLVTLDINNFDFSSITNISSIFSTCSALINLTFGINLGKGYTQKSNNYSSYTIGLNQCNNLNHDSLMSVINNLYDLNLTYNVANGGTLYTQKLTLGSTNLAKLTADEIAIATNKGWTVS